ncbi:zinc finger protein 277 isoform X2 [Alexandromys fortis]|uniref:zinc finger protein 277 isoform X2 n=1 Tax=Alexandromys fortis TaxID=100897 RepID=UPI0021532A4A|nr:zinc finger protein 277 isoform X2 [Microtus fortis]
MAATEAQRLGAGQREDAAGVHGGVGSLDHEDSEDCILEPLSLPESPGGSTALAGPPSVPCIFCEEHFPVAEQDKLLKHMIIEHKIVIADVKLVADFQRYILYWRKRFTEQPITDFCSVIRINSTAPFEEQDNYFLLCDVLPEDRVLREELQKQKLKEILDQQQRERNDTSFRGVCMFCTEEFHGNRSVLLNHMAREHAFNIGLPDNIVNCAEFLHTLQKKLDNLQCLYCEKTFRDKNTLKDHMRKKQHRRINPKNRDYDRFYVINYLELGKSWEEVQLEDDRELLDLPEDDWSDWQEYPVCAVCLFCEKQEETIDQLYVHMKDTHGFDLLRIKSELVGLPVKTVGCGTPCLCCETMPPPLPSCKTMNGFLMSNIAVMILPMVTTVWKFKCIKTWIVVSLEHSLEVLYWLIRIASPIRIVAIGF